jgi:hypothetical protein
MHKGSCECGAVRFETTGSLRPVQFCHCTQCRKTSGHFWAATSVADANFELNESRALRWYKSSGSAERGFSVECGSSLFWKPMGQQRISIAAGAFDEPSDLTQLEHIFVSDKGDYYDITDGLPQKEKY